MEAEQALIQHFKHKGLRELFATGNSSRVPSTLRKRCTAILDFLDSVTHPLAMRVRRGWRFHSYKGDRSGAYGVDVNGPWRITFTWDMEAGGARDVNLEQEH